MQSLKFAYIFLLLAGSCSATAQRNPLGDAHTFHIKIDDKIWDADVVYYSIVPLDADSTFLMGIHASRSGMDMDPENRGWDLRLFIELPSGTFTHRETQFTFEGNRLHGALLEHDEEEIVVQEGQILFSGSYTGVPDTLIWTSFSGSYTLKGSQNKIYSGEFKIVHHQN